MAQILRSRPEDRDPRLTLPSPARRALRRHFARKPAEPGLSRFQHLADEARPNIVGRLTLSFMTTRALIGERLRALRDKFA